MTKKAIIVGASGLIGSNLLAILLAQADYDEVLLIARKKIKLTNNKVKQVVVDFDHLEQYADILKGDVLFCCLGTTRKKTPDIKEYKKIDHDYPVELAKIALKNDIAQFHIVSSIGADSSSSSFYLKTKGETEHDLKEIGLNSLFIYQPSFLVGHRDKQRFGEQAITLLLKIFNPFLIGNLKKYRAIQSTDVAKAMYKQSLKNKTGVFTYTSDKIKERS